MGSLFSYRNPSYKLADDGSISEQKQMAELSDSTAKREQQFYAQNPINVKLSYQSTEVSEHVPDDRIQIDIDEQTNIDLNVHERKTLWHKCKCCCSTKLADAILGKAQSCQGVLIGVILVLVYCFALHTFDRGDFGIISVVYSIIILFVTVPGSILYFGTINAAICWALLKRFNFWFKISNVIICNCMSIIWAYHNIDFNAIVIPEYIWFVIYGMYFLVNVITSAMGCLLDGFVWPRAMKIGGPLMLFGYFLDSSIYWHYQSHAQTKIDFHLSSYQQGYLISTIAASSAANAAVFFLSQGVYAIFYPDVASVLEATVNIKWSESSITCCRTKKRQ